MNNNHVTKLFGSKCSNSILRLFSWFLHLNHIIIILFQCDMVSLSKFFSLQLILLDTKLEMEGHILTNPKQINNGSSIRKKYVRRLKLKKSCAQGVKTYTFAISPYHERSTQHLCTAGCNCRHQGQSTTQRQPSTQTFFPSNWQRYLLIRRGYVFTNVYAFLTGITDDMPRYHGQNKSQWTTEPEK